MYDEFRHFAKENLKSKRMTYYKLAKKIGFTESTIKCFKHTCRKSHAFDIKLYAVTA